MVVILAWSTTPDGTGLEQRLHAHLESTTGRPVPFDRLAPWLRDAVVATEDERFYRHRGIDGIGVLRALPYDLVHLSFAQGASTITEQVAKVLYLDGNDHSLWRKLEDAALAVKLEGRYDKKQILDAYLNSVYFGEGAYGDRRGEPAVLRGLASRPRPRTSQHARRADPGSLSLRPLPSPHACSRPPGRGAASDGRRRLHDG